MKDWPVFLSLSILVMGALAFLLFRLNSGASPAEIKKVRTAMEALQKSCETYFDEYSQLPLGSNSSTDQVKLTTGKGEETIMTALCAPISAMEESYKLMNIFTFKTTPDRKDGLVRNEEGTYAELFDPWGNPYHLLLDYDYDKELEDPFSGEIIADKKVLIWSLGPDGKSGTPETDKDNLYSWK